FYDLQGNRRIGVERDVRSAVQMYPNAVEVFDDGIFISNGWYLAYEAVEVDGEPGVRLITIPAMRAIEEEKRQQWIDAHPDVISVKPAWADSADVTEIDGDVVYLAFA